MIRRRLRDWRRLSRRDWAEIGHTFGLPLTVPPVGDPSSTVAAHERAMAALDPQKGKR